MSGRLARSCALSLVYAFMVSGAAATGTASADAQKPVVQKQDAEYAAKIKEHPQDPRVITELVDHLPAGLEPLNPRLKGQVDDPDRERDHADDKKHQREDVIALQWIDSQDPAA